MGVLCIDGELGRVQSVVRAFGMLDILAEHSDGLNLIALSRLVKLPRSTAHRLLSTMDDLGYAEFDPKTSRWTVGERAFAVGRVFSPQRKLSRLARPMMKTLMNETGRTVNLSVATEDAVFFVSQVTAPGACPNIVAPGRHLPFHSTAAGKALMACWSSEHRSAFLNTHALTAITNRSIVDRAQFEAHLDEVRRSDCAYDLQESTRDLYCVAAPIAPAAGEAVAALSVSGTLEDRPAHALERLAPAVIAAAKRIGARIGDHRDS